MRSETGNCAEKNKRRNADKPDKAARRARFDRHWLNAFRAGAAGGFFAFKTDVGTGQDWLSALLCKLERLDSPRPEKYRDLRGRCSRRGVTGKSRVP